MDQMRAWPKLRSTVVLAMAYTADHADHALLTSMYTAIGRALHIAPTQLGLLSMYRGLTEVTARLEPSSTRLAAALRGGCCLESICTLSSLCHCNSSTAGNRLALERNCVSV